jgi:hypothetical protein
VPEAEASRYTLIQLTVSSGRTVGAVKTFLRLLLAALVSVTALSAHAQRTFESGELEALLAPIALYPDPLLSQILTASQFPDQVQAAADWSRANPQLSGDAALATVQSTPWDPSVKALVAYPDVLARMVESPQWLADLGQAYATNGPNVMATVQELRARAQASGYLQSNDQQSVYQQGEAIYVQPTYPNVVYAPYYDPYLVYGAGFWTAFRPVYWRPWVAYPVVVTRYVPARPVRWYVYPYQRPPLVHGGPTVTTTPYRPVPESRRAPFVHSGGPAFVQSAPAVRSAPQAPQRVWRPGTVSQFKPTASHFSAPSHVAQASRGGWLGAVRSQVRSQGSAHSGRR